jgi:hypothetical protein
MVVSENQDVPIRAARPPLFTYGGRRAAPNRVSFYTRISTDEDHQKYSLGAQKERLEAYCKAQWGDDWRVRVGERPHRPRRCSP